MEGIGPRSSLSLTDLRGTPFVDHFLSKLPLGHEKALKYAFYNVLALLLAAFAILAVYGVYCILEPFIKALLWALLCGSVLHPAKAALSESAQSWLKRTKTSNTPFTVSLICSPLWIADSTSERIGNWVVNFWKPILSFALGFLIVYVIYYNSLLIIIFDSSLLCLQTIGTILSWILSWLSLELILTLNAVYIATFAHYIYSKRSSNATNPTKPTSHPSKVTSSTNPTDEPDLSLKRQAPKPIVTPDSFLTRTVPLISYLTWLLTLAYLSLLLPYPLLLASALFILIGVVTYLRRSTTVIQHSLPSISRYAAMMVLNIGSNTTLTNLMSPPSRIFNMDRTDSAMNSDPLSSKRATFASKRSYSEGIPRKRRSSPSLLQFPSPANVSSTTQDWDPNEETLQDEHSSILDSNKFLYIVFLACLLVQIWNHLWLLNLLPIPIAYYGLKKLLIRLRVVPYLEETLGKPFLEFYNDPHGPSQYLFPQPVRIGLKILRAGDRKLVGICEMYLDPVTSFLVLILLVLCTILGCIFAATQVYAEGDHLVRVGVNLINSTVSQHPEISQLLPEGWENLMDSFVDNAYVYGKEYITNLIRDSIEEKNPEKAEQIESQVIQLWDRIYISWNQIWRESAVNKTANSHWGGILESGKEMPNLLELSLLSNYAKANIGTIWSILESAWAIIIGNVSVALSALTAIISLLFGGGTAIINLLINLVVFFTALFYLLNASTSVYKPVELFNYWSPGTGFHTNSFAIAVEDSVNGVFVASFKMAAFYGMWTWLIHTLFQVNIVFVPSIFGALFGAVPFLSPYFAALPACLELWLIQGYWYKALAMFLCTLLPMSIVDTQIYSEIKAGSHPYLTGLAVAGGIFCFGVQGAIMGPVILCCVVVAVKISGSFLRMEDGKDMIDHGLGTRPGSKNKIDSDISNFTAFSSTPIQGNT